MTKISITPVLNEKNNNITYITAVSNETNEERIQGN